MGREDWLEAIKKSHLTFDEAPPDPVTVETEQPERLRSVDARSAVRAAETIEDLMALADGENRKSVLEEIEKRHARLISAQQPPE